MDMKPMSVARRRAGRSTDIHIKSEPATNEDTDAEMVSSSVTDTDRDTVTDFEPEPVGAASGGWKKCYDFSRLSSREKLSSPNRISYVGLKPQNKSQHTKSLRQLSHSKHQKKGEKTFFSSNLFSHVRTNHHGVKPLLCTECDAPFSK